MLIEVSKNEVAHLYLYEPTDSGRSLTNYFYCVECFHPSAQSCHVAAAQPLKLSC